MIEVLKIGKRRREGMGEAEGMLAMEKIPGGVGFLGCGEWMRKEKGGLEGLGDWIWG